MPKRRWFQYSLRTFLVLLTAFGVWLGLHLQSARRQAKAVAAIKAYGGEVYYDYSQYELEIDGLVPKAESWVPKWLIAKLGEDFFHDVQAVNLSDYEGIAKRQRSPLLTTDALPHLFAFPELKALHLQKAQATDDAMRLIGDIKTLEDLTIWDAPALTDVGARHLKNLRNLKYLQLQHTGITDDSLKTFSQMERLESLRLDRNDISNQGLFHLRGMVALRVLSVGHSSNFINDKGLAYLRGLKNLRSLEVAQSTVTAKGLRTLATLESLRSLDIQNTGVTMKGIRALAGVKSLQDLWLAGDVGEDLTQARQVLPNCRIVLNGRSLP